MAIDKSTNYSLNKPTKGTRNWHDYLNSNTDTIDTEMKRLKDKDASQDLRIDNILNETSTTKDLELTDARLGSDGVARATLGELTREMHSELLDSNQQTATLTHGQNLIQSDTPSPLKVEFYPEHRVNYQPDGNFESQGKWGSDLVIDNSTYKFGTSSGKIDNSAGTSAKQAYNNNNLYINGKHIFVGIWIKANSGNPSVSLQILGFDSSNVYNNEVKEVVTTADNQWKLYYLKADLTSTTSAYWKVRLRVNSYGTTSDIVFFDGNTVTSLTSEQFNAIGVTLTDADVERMFPYVDSIKPVKNIWMKVSGENHISPFTEWTLPTEAKINSAYDVTTTQGANQYTLTVVPSQVYSLGVDTNLNRLFIYAYDKTGNQSTLASSADITGYRTLKFTTPANAVSIKVYAYHTITGSNYYIKNPILNIGDTVRPFTPKDDSYIYVEGEFYGNDNQKDILFRNESLDVPRWEVKREFKGRDLTGDDSWSLYSDVTGLKTVRTAFADSQIYTSEVVKYDGKILTPTDTLTTVESNADYQRLNHYLYVSVSDVDSGWTDAMTPTAKMIKGYFNGWKYTGDGTTHSWASIVDGSSAPTQTEDYVSTNQAPSYENYFLLYQLAKPVTEVVRHEGDLSITGDAIVETGVGLINREPITPVYAPSGTYHINNLGLSGVTDNPLNKRVEKIVKIYKGVDDDTHNWTILNQPTYSYGDYRAYIDDALYDSTKNYYVVYEILDKYTFTTNINEVIVNYSSSLKSSFERVVEKQSDIATDVSVHKNAIINIYARLKVLEENQTVL